jgi:hypothetical protein
MGKSVLKQVRFNLRFDDPRQPNEGQIVVQGDRDQLEALYTAVSGYVQDILQQSPENFWASRIEGQNASKNSVPNAVEDIINSEKEISIFKHEFAAKRGDIYLQPSSHLTHKLFLGSLASRVHGDSIELSLLQLFDLATALDEYTADVVALPTNTQPRRGNSFAMPAWAPVAAVLVLGLGLMPLTYQYANRLREQNQTGESVASANKEIGSDASTTPSLTPLPIPNSLLTPSPNASPLPTLGTGLTVRDPLSPSSLTSPNPNLSATPKPGSTFPSASTNPSSSLSNIPPLPPLGSSTLVKPQEGGTINLSPNSPSTKTQGGNSSTTITKTNLPNTSLPSLTNPSIAEIPVLPSKQAAPLPPAENNSGNTLTNSSKKSSELLEQLRQSRADSAANNGQKSTATTAAANSETLFDTNQVAEVRNYFKERWQPPSGLKAPLQYSLTVGVDGALEQILPLGKSARDYVDKAGIPQIGEPFVSPSRNGQNVKIRAVFKPNGEVQTFPEND